MRSSVPALRRDRESGISTRVRLRLIAALILLGPQVAAFSQAAQKICPELSLRVVYEAPEDADIVCTAGKEATAFMERHGFAIGLPIAVRVVRDLPSKPHLPELGQFDAKTMEVRVLAWEYCVKIVGDRPPFGVPFNIDLHRSVVVHEIAHAIAQHNFQVEKPSIEAQEYIAYTVQLATMAVPLRDRILHRYAVPGFLADSEITSLYLALDPASFGVKAYRHFLGTNGGAPFFRRLLTGDFQPPEWF